MPATAPDDATLLRQMRQGNAQAFSALYRRHQGALFRYAVLRCGSPATAADVVQELFLGLLSDRFAYDPLRGPLGHFLFGVARTLLLRHARPDPRETVLDDEDEDASPASADTEPLTRLLSNETSEAVRRALAALAPSYRDAVILYELHDLSYLDIAAICQVEIGTVRSRLARGRAALARALASHRSPA